jgi:triosephosphate isomerase
MTTRKFFVGGNWKMNGSLAQLTSLCSQLSAAKFDSTLTGMSFLNPSTPLFNKFMRCDT